MIVNYTLWIYFKFLRILHTFYTFRLIYFVFHSKVICSIYHFIFNSSDLLTHHLIYLYLKESEITFIIR